MIGFTAAGTTDREQRALRDVREKRLLIDKQDRWLIDLVSPYLGQRVLEVGCGWGNVLRLIDDRVSEIVAIDVDPESVEQVRSMYGDNSSVSVQVGDICDASTVDSLGSGYDSVLSVNVLEHIEDDTRALLNMKRLIRPHGYLLLVVPAHPALYNQMDESIGHYRRYRKSEFAKRMTDLGCEVVEMRYVNALGAIGWALAGRVFRKETAPSGQLRLMNALIPSLRWCESLVKPPFGTSLVAVLR